MEIKTCLRMLNFSFKKQSCKDKKRFEVYVIKAGACNLNLAFNYHFKLHIYISQFLKPRCITIKLMMMVMMLLCKRSPQRR